MQKMRNTVVRDALKRYGLRQWQLADLLGIHEQTLCTRLRHELPIPEQNRMVELIKEHAGGEHDKERFS